MLSQVFLSGIKTLKLVLPGFKAGLKHKLFFKLNLTALGTTS
jgi:hypothetical protein